MNFPSREEMMKYPHQIIKDELDRIDLDKIDFDGSDFKPRSEISESQKVYFWVRVYLKDNYNIEPNTEIKMKYLPDNEELITRFICYNKSGRNNSDENIVSWNPEDDKKVLCLMIDSDRINNNSDDIQFIRSLFKIGRYYKPQILSKNQFILIDSSKNSKIDYYDIDF